MGTPLPEVHPNHTRVSIRGARVDGMAFLKRRPGSEGQTGGWTSTKTMAFFVARSGVHLRLGQKTADMGLSGRVSVTWAMDP